MRNWIKTLGIASSLVMGMSLAGCGGPEGEDTFETSASSLASYATIQGQFIDENDWWADGKVPGATITVYSQVDGSILGSGTTDQNGYFSVSGPFFNINVRVEAVPPVTANCKSSYKTAYLFVDAVLETMNFKDECKF
ncbi:hypothetical protein BO221_23665 [Archangium sp. Cb G35]|uniref:carboxypeptidase regulatory-like domain-containing protein n=1 Tax=Archangium sp. Cb G35 TaxID=1920190 RepID=UPI0009362154|nr:carboxypeptidase regulatory-like domain-containing protein [Archangium sp. Cb G35]OJT21779.1 hypothetical protein BO221_23665 [Archangium sp. Cb G35]